MSATEAPAKVSRHTQITVRDRWDTLMVGVDPYNGEETNSEMYLRLSHGLRTVAGRIVHGVHGDREYSALCQLEQGLMI